MKKLLSLLLATLYFGGLRAQEVKLGVFTGMNISHPSELDSRLGFNVGAKGELQFQNNMYLELGLSLSSKGWKSIGYYDAATQETKVWKGTPYYFEIPLHFGYKFSVGENVKVLGSVGPYAGLGMFGKSTCSVESKNNVVKTTTSDNLFKDKLQERFDWGVGVTLGVEIHNHYQLSLGYNWGLKNIYKKGNGQGDSKNRIFNVSFAYLF